jgi:hypothetical protein
VVVTVTWTKTGDEFADECWTLSDAAYRLHHEGLTWSNRKGTDGRLNKDDMVRWAKRPEAAEELVAIGWWKNKGDHFQIVHHLGYQRTKAQVASQSLANQKNAARRWGKNSSSCESHNESQSEPQSELTCEMDRTGQVQNRPGQESTTGEKNYVNGAVLEQTDECVKCRQFPPLGLLARSGENPMLCDACNRDLEHVGGD